MFIVKQKGPTCGMYALLNGIFMLHNIKGFRTTKTHKIVLRLLKENQLDNNHDKDNDAKGRTFVGEFFDIEEYCSFITNNKELITNEISNYFGEDIRFEVQKVLFSRIKNETNALFIVPILDNEIKSNGQVISHWISLKLNKKNGKYKVANSRSRVMKSLALSKIQEKHFNLEDGSFYWNRYKRKKYMPAFNSIEKYVRNRLKKKYDFIEKRILKNKINYTTGEVIMIRRL